MVKLRIVSWNADGLVGKKMELMQLLQELDADIALVQETHLRQGLIFNLPNYQTYRTDRQHGGRGSGGTAAFVHRRLPHRSILLNLPPGLEVTTVAVRYDGAELQISSIYNPPRGDLQPHHLDDLLRPDTPALLIGDMNGKHQDWGCRATNTTGRRIKTYLETHPHVHLLAPEEPTHYDYRGFRPDILDIGLSGSFESDIDVFVVSDLSSDHLPVVFDIPDDGTINYTPLGDLNLHHPRLKPLSSWIFKFRS
jgi:endonuclease/exonuclease/phosphatase (EEP) superfamily protein YafD